MIFAVNILQFIFLSLKLDNIVEWSWVVSEFCHNQVPSSWGFQGGSCTAYNCIHGGFGGAGVKATAFHLWVRGFDSRYGLMWRVSQRSAESRGFSPGAPVSSHRESWQGGLG
jgi:hypothetical protein